ncbi:MAG: nitrate reductase molybdenum cofactor assembly chaperone [Hydrogenophilales bacterium]|nr:nitrate reductase molybdenum cofactor assembly chaperone [Hydrogenophilales bacterium]
MKSYQALALLLTYPEQAWIDHLDEVEALLVQEAAINADAAPRLQALFSLLREQSPIELQQNYVATFDQNPSHSLHLFEHIHGESRDRGQAMVDLIEEYRKHDLEIDAGELPDYVPLFLEYLSILPSEDAATLLGEAIDVLALIGRKLHANGSPYHTVFDVLQTLSPVEAQPLPEPPVRDMDEAMERFGPAIDGREPLLTPQTQIAYAGMPVSRRQPAAAQGI